MKNQQFQCFFMPARYTFIILIFTLGQISGCSWLSSRRSLFGSEAEEVKMVPKTQYDDLLSKYETLLKKERQDAREDGQSPTKGESEVVEKVELMDSLAKVGPGKELVETVDVGISNSKTEMPASANGAYSQDIVGSELKKYEKAKNLLAQNQVDAAMRLLKEVELSKVDTIRVHAKYLVGEIMFRQGEFDLSMQIFEEIIQKDAFSGVVLKALGRLVVCAERLKLSKKKDRYFSMLHDFFEVES